VGFTAAHEVDCSAFMTIALYYAEDLLGADLLATRRVQ